MPSPFPGMNPYLENPSAWHDFHKNFIPLASEALGKQILPRYFVRINAQLYVHEPVDESRRLAGRADPSVTSDLFFATPSNPGTGLLTAPAEVTVPEVDVERICYLEVVDRETRRVVTVVELLSPSNKLAGADRDQYVSKVRQLMWTNVNVVEIDLLRCGSRMHWLGMSPCDYCVVVSRPEESPRAGLWPIQLRDRLPEIPVPLHPGVADALLDLQQLLHRIYDSAGYGYYIYDRPPEPVLSPADAEWARTFVPAGSGH